MFMAERSPVKVTAVIRKSLDIAQRGSIPQNKVPGITGKDKTFRNRNPKEGMKPVFFNQ